MTEDVGRRPATVAEARELLGTPEARRGSRATAHAPDRGSSRVSEGALGRQGPRPVAAAAGRLLLAAAGRLRRRGAEGRGHRHGRLRPLGAALLRGRRRLREVGALPRAQPRQALDPAQPQGGARAARCCCGSCASTTSCSSRSGPACSTGSASATSGCARRTRGLVYCAITGYGQDGPYRDRSGHDMNYLGLIGLLGLTGERGRPAGPGGRPDRRPRRRRADGRVRDPGRAARARPLAARASSSTSRWPTARCRWLAMVAAQYFADGRSRRSAATSSWPARSSVTGPTRAATATSRSARSSRSSGRRGAAASGART